MVDLMQYASTSSIDWQAMFFQVLHSASLCTISLTNGVLCTLLLPFNDDVCTLFQYVCVCRHACFVNFTFPPIHSFLQFEGMFLAVVPFGMGFYHSTSSHHMARSAYFMLLPQNHRIPHAALALVSLCLCVMFLFAYAFLLTFTMLGRAFLIVSVSIFFFAARARLNTHACALRSSSLEGNVVLSRAEKTQSHPYRILKSSCYAPLAWHRRRQLGPTLLRPLRVQYQRASKQAVCSVQFSMCALFISCASFASRARL